MCLKPKFVKFSKVSKPNGKRDIVFVPFERRFEPDTFAIPCGKCDECRLDYARNWSIRCQCEAQLHEHNYFVTLTYNDENLPEAKSVILEDCNIKDNRSIWINTLVPSHLTEFNKALRQYYARNYNHYGIRFFGCGEYGSLEHTARPHYHVIFFNLPIYDLKPYKKLRGNQLYVSQTLNDIWKKGFVVIGEVTPESCGYVARYNYKKQIKGSRLVGVEPEFVRMSRRPGIGYQWFIDNYEKLQKTDFEVCLNGKKYSLNPYFRRLLGGFDLDLLADISNRHRYCASLRDKSLIDYDLTNHIAKSSMNKKILKKDNISLDKTDIMLYNNRVETTVRQSE